MDRGPRWPDTLAGVDASGRTKIKVMCFENDGGAALSMRWSPPTTWSAGIVRGVDDRPTLEAIVLYLDPSGIRHVYPHGRETLRGPWEPDLDPTESIVDAVAAVGLAPVMVHSTSWRIVQRGLVLTFLVVIDPPAALPESCEVEQVTRAELARGRATGAPESVHLSQVVEHGLRHLAWLVAEDDAIHDALAPWSEALGAYAREPFRAFGHDAT